MHTYDTCEGGYIKKQKTVIDTVCIKGKCVDTSRIRSVLISVFSALGIACAAISAAILMF